MKRTILCLLAALMVCAMFSAAAEEPQPLTASELDTHMERVRNRAMAAEPLNDPADEEARSEDGTLFRYQIARIYATGTALT